MNAGLFRRGMALIADFIVVAALVSITFTIAARPIYVSLIPDFDTLHERYGELQGEKREARIQLDNEEYYLNRAQGISDPKRDEWLTDILNERSVLLGELDALEDSGLSGSAYESEEARIMAALEELDLQEDILDYDEHQLAARFTEIADERVALNEYYSYRTFPEEYAVGDGYVLFGFLYAIISFSVFHIVYMLALKGHSLGRRLMRLKLAGNINVLSLLLREFFWKYVYWVLTLGFGIFIDIYMCLLTQDQKTPRDYFSKTRVILAEVVYPF